MVCAVERHRLFGPQAPHEIDLLAQPLTAVGEGLAEGFVLDGVPAEPDTEAQTPLAEEVDLGCLLGQPLQPAAVSRLKVCFVWGQDASPAPSFFLP